MEADCLPARSGKGTCHDVEGLVGLQGYGLGLAWCNDVSLNGNSWEKGSAVTD